MDVVSTQRKMAAGATVRSSSNGENGGESQRRTTTPLRRHLRRRSSSAPPATRHRFVEDHYRVDTANNVVLPGVPKHDDDWARDSHDFFNLIVLVPVVVLNIMNWNWDVMLDSRTSVADAWTGEYFDVFLHVTLLYFVVDLLWVSLVPSCVKSPATIIQHHIATLIYMMVPYLRPELRWCMGACMSVEVNTWFLIARRVFNKQGLPPWIIDLPPFLSLRIKLISIFFYLTWIPIRCILYPYLLVEFAQLWLKVSAEVGTKWNVVALTLPLHSVFCILNYRWTYDLLMSKIRYWRKKGNKQQRYSKGL